MGDLSGRVGSSKGTVDYGDKESDPLNFMEDTVDESDGDAASDLSDLSDQDDTTEVTRTVSEEEEERRRIEAAKRGNASTPSTTRQRLVRAKNMCRRATTSRELGGRQRAQPPSVCFARIAALAVSRMQKGERILAHDADDSFQQLPMGRGALFLLLFLEGSTAHGPPRCLTCTVFFF